MRKNIVRKVVVMMFAVIGVLMMTACGSDDDNKTVLDTEKVLEEVSEEASMSVVEGTEISSEDAIVIAEEGFRVIKQLNPEGMIKSTNIELLYYSGGGEEAKEEDMLDFITELVNKMDENYNSMGIVGQYSRMENVELYDAELVSEEELDEINTLMIEDPMSMFEGLEYYPYSVEKAYKVQMRYDFVEENKETYMYVVYANGQWELDVYISAVRDVYQALKEMM